MSIVNWSEVQAYYDGGKTHIETAGKFKISMSDLRQAEMKGFFRTVSLSQAMRPAEVVDEEVEESEERTEKPRIILKKKIKCLNNNNRRKANWNVDWNKVQQKYDEYKGNITYKDLMKQFNFTNGQLKTARKNGYFIDTYKINWKSIQDYYNEGHTQTDTANKFNITLTSIQRAKKRGDFDIKCRKNIIKHNKYNSLDWVRIQAYYDDGNTIRETAKNFKISKNMIQRAGKQGDFKSRTLCEAGVISRRKYPRKHTIETKKKLSAIRIKYLRENLHIKMFPKNGESYPEKYFKECLKNSTYKSPHRFLQYELDFADIERKINLEIDGEQHFTTDKAIKHDEIRNKTLIELGWKVIRVRWKKFVKLSKQKKEIIISKIIRGGDDLENDGTIYVFNGLLNPKAIAKFQEDIEKKNPKCSECNSPVYIKSKICKECYTNKRNFNPDKEEFEKFLEDGMTVPELAKFYDFSEKTIRKKMNKLGLGRFLKTSKKFDPDERELTNLLKEGNTQADLARYYKIDPSTVKNKIKKLHLECYLEKKKVFNPDKNEMLKLLENGKNSVDLAKYYNVSALVIRDRMRKLDLGHFIGLKKCTKLENE